MTILSNSVQANVVKNQTVDEQKMYIVAVIFPKAYMKMTGSILNLKVPCHTHFQIFIFIFLSQDKVS